MCGHHLIENSFTPSHLICTLEYVQCDRLLVRACLLHILSFERMCRQRVMFHEVYSILIGSEKQSPLPYFDMDNGLKEQLPFFPLACSGCCNPTADSFLYHSWFPNLVNVAIHTTISLPILYLLFIICLLLHDCVITMVLRKQDLPSVSKAQVAIWGYPGMCLKKWQTLFSC